ncbi:hypothetical protein [Streptomyces sp. NPDC046805]|uniref:hypothetical protein n=1 Tax=Streptomyces sp. NPDC046805 TaxID=3155134 RepID=UPI0033D68A20
MSQPQFQPPSHNPYNPQNPYNPYTLPAPPQQQQQPGFSPPPAPEQPPMQAGPPTAQPPMQAGTPSAPPQSPAYPGPPPAPAAQQPTYQPYGPYPTPAPVPAYQPSPYGQQQPTTDGRPVGAILLALLASFIVSLLYTGLTLATYKDQSNTAAYVLYVTHAFVNGAVVGALAGKVGRSSTGARVGAAVIAPLGAVFGYTNAIPLIIADGRTPKAIQYMLEDDPFLPAKAWWGHSAGSTLVSLLGLLVAAVVAWGLAYVVGGRSRQA